MAALFKHEDGGTDQLPFLVLARYTQEHSGATSGLDLLVYFSAFLF